jgi:hypothetical protein
VKSSHLTHKSAIATLVALFMVLMLSGDGAGADDMYTPVNLIRNFDFSSYGVDEQGIPLHWVIFSIGPAAHVEISDEMATVGSHSLKMIDTDPQKSVGLRSHRVEAKPGRRYVAEVDVYGIDGSAGLYIDFLDANGRRVQEKISNTTARNRWETLRSEATAPEGTAYVTLILYSSITNVGTFYCDNVRLYDVTEQPLKITERQPTARQLGYLPEDGSRVSVNPPPLIWLPEAQAVSYVVEYGPDPEFSASSFTRIENVGLPLYVPAHTFEPGTWYWRYWGVSANGEVFGPSQVRSFVVDPGLPEIPLPPAEEWMARIPRTHPRMFIRPEQVQAVRDSVNLRMLPSIFTKGRLAALTGVELPKEPRSAYETGSLDIDVWRSELNAIVPSFEILEELAFLYLLTEDEAYGREGKKLLLHLAAMDPKGSTSYSGAPEIAMRMIYFIPRAYSWLYDTMTEAERDIVRTSARARGEEAYRMLKNLPFETVPYSSHPGRMLGFLGQLSIAFFDEIPEARHWLEYVVILVAGVYPAWGGEDGGYSEGHSYWSSYLTWMFDFLDAINVAAGLDFYKKPFFQQTGYFAIYGLSVGTGQPFSDGINGRTGAGTQLVMTQLARKTQNPHFRWYVDRIGGVGWRSKFHMILPQDPIPDAEVPSELPNARWFRDIDWVALHRNLITPETNIQFTMKSSRYGSSSHGYADQNAFVIYAAGDGLAVSSGYYPYYGSPHHSQWTNQTLSKNSLLIDGQGQIPNSMDASGKILGLFHSNSYDYTAGEAARAYPHPYLKRFTRHVIYLRPNLFLLIDDVRADKPVDIDWLMHSRFAIAWDGAKQQARVDGNKASLDVHLLYPGDFQAEVTDGFNPPPETTSWQNEWHLKASVGTKDDSPIIVSLLVPQVTADSDPHVVDAKATVDGDEINVLITYASDGGSLITEEVAVRLPDGKSQAGVATVLATARDERQKTQRALASMAEGIDVDDTQQAIRGLTAGWSATAQWFEDESFIAVELGRVGAHDQGVRHEPGQGVRFELVTQFEPRKITVNGFEIEDWSYDASRGMVSVKY